MALNLQEKQAVVAEVSAEVAKAQTIVLAEYRGIEVGDITKLRKEHLSKDVMAQIIAAGPQQGDQIAQSILSGQGGVGAVNKLWQQIQKASKGLGAQAAMAQYGGYLSPDLRKAGVSSGGVSINVNVGGGGHGTLDLTPSQIAQIVAAVQAALLKQAKKNNKGGDKKPDDDGKKSKGFTNPYKGIPPPFMGL